MTLNSEATLQDLINAIKPWFPQEQVFLLELAKRDIKARLIIAITLAESGQVKEAGILLESILATDNLTDPDDRQALFRARLELANVRMEQLKYDEAEAELWKARNGYVQQDAGECTREDISLLIAQCRFGQGFIQDAIDRAEEVLRKLQSSDAASSQLAKTYQQLGWYYLHKKDVPSSLQHIKTAMKLSPTLDRELVNEAMKAEEDGNFEKAIEYYFDSILLDS